MDKSSVQASNEVLEHKWIFVGLPHFTQEDVNDLNTWVKDGTFVFVG